MGSDIILAPILVGLGIDELSVSPSLAPQVKYLIRNLKYSEAKELADWALNVESANEILERSRAFARSIAPCLFENKHESNP
jgi:phosphotransferase system enzyme I (PtsI)